ncbi:hypothetical protein Fcan01_13280 [Folsomia candida]|uniref:Uncharacterized protein n=2 Tax=Folsomia candida TaxID=158441 RepID=A0A226E1G0_FOLCA|nr:hypothetical protein Fcan01_13280 [Folsomia candida]
MDIRPEDWHLWNCSSATSSNNNKRHRDDLHHEKEASPGKKARKNKGGQSSGSKEDDNYSMEIGTLKLKTDIMPPSLSNTLFRREIGLPRSVQFSPKIDYHLIQLLLASRSPAGKVPMEPVTHSVPKFSAVSGTTASSSLLNPFNPTKKWFRTRNETGEKKFEFVDEYIMIKDRACNTRRFMVPSAPLLHTPFTLNYLIADNDKTKLKWRDTDVRYINTCNPQMISGLTVAKLPNTLMVLEPLKLLAYDLNTGKKLDEISVSFVGGPTHYSSVHVDEKLDDQIIVYASTASVKKSNPEMTMELLILSYPKLRISHRLLIPKSGDFGGLDDISIFQDLVLITKPGWVELFSLQELMDINPKSNSSTMDQCLETVRFTTKPQPLAKFKSKGSHFLHISAMYPPHVCIKTNNSYEVRSLENPEQLVVSLPSKTHEGDVTVWNYDDQRPRIIVSGLLHGFDIFSVDSGNLEILFSTKGFAKSDAASDGSRQAGSSSSSRRNGMRQLEKKNYADIDSSRSFGFAYDGNLDLLAVCMVDDGILHSTIYDNKTFRPFRKLVPVKLVTPKRVGMLLGCSNIAVLFNDGHLSVRLDLFDASGTGDPFQELYTVNLLGEVVPED